MDINDLTTDEVIKVLKAKLEASNMKKIKELENKLEKEKKRYLKSLQYFKAKLYKNGRKQ